MSLSKIFMFLRLAAGVALLPGTPAGAEGLVGEPLRAAAAAGPGAALFTALNPADTGVEFVNALVAGHPLEHLYAAAMAVGGVAIGDVDGDGRCDLYFTNGPAANRLFRQSGEFTFQDITAKAGVDGGGSWSAGAAMADLDGDGDLDIYVANYGAPNFLFVNKGDGTFEEKARLFGLDIVSASQMPTFSDYDRDGDLDLYLLCNRFYSEFGQPLFNDAVELRLDANRINVIWRDEKWGRYFTVRQDGKRPDGLPFFKLFKIGQDDRLLRNDGPGEDGSWKFTEVGKEAGIVPGGFGLSATWFDYDQDGWPDLWVGNDLDDPDCVYHNNRDGTFANVVKTVGPHVTWFSMGADFADLNGDAMPDFLIADMSGTNHFKQKTAMGAMGIRADFLRTANPQQYMRNALFVNSGTERFLEGAHLSGLANSDWTWTVKLADFDNDGRPDVYFTNGMTRDFNEPDNLEAVPKVYETEWDRHLRAGTPELREQNLAYRNRGDLAFEDVSKEWGLAQVGMSFAAAHADLDGDGDLDLVVANAEEAATIYRNNSHRGKRLVIRLKGRHRNTFGLGAQLTLETAAGKQIRELTPVRGYLSSNQPVVHFGLGDVAVVDRLIVDWPSGHRQEFEAVAANQRLTITEPAGKGALPTPRMRKSAPLYVESKNLAGAFHSENEYDDYARQPLLPHKLSRFGPGQAWGDLDGDGDDDFWMGSGYGQPGQLWRNEGRSKFVRLPAPALEADKNREDMAGLWLDTDGDRDLDLFVVSGGYEFGKDTAFLDDRLYLNDGKGTLRRASKDPLPGNRVAGGVVRAADFDRDGDLDLFVGGRLVPGEYPATPASILLRNEGGRFTDQTAALAPGLRKGGLVTSALWSDVDRDGWQDLLVTHDWGPVKFYRNTNGKLSDQSEAAGLVDLTGWWNGIAASDFDRDGDLDYVATNFGLNTKYHPSPGKPVLIYYGDFENAGRKRIVEAEYENDILYPVRGRSCSTNAMPHLGKKYGSFRKFALDDLDSIYTPKCLHESLKVSATTLESGVFRNDTGKDGKVRFSFHPLPRLAQIAPSFGVVAGEIDGDGVPDLVLAQNFYSPQAETGRMAGGLGMVLLGNGDATFRTLSPHHSGFVVPGDARSLSTADLDGDGRLDLAVGINGSRPRSFLHRAPKRGSILTARLARPEPGVRVVCKLSDGSTQTAEWQSGGGYLSQHAPVVSFGVPAGTKVTGITAHWPDGTRTGHTLDAGADTVSLDR